MMIHSDCDDDDDDNIIIIIIVTERESGRETQVGIKAAGEATEGHRTRKSRRFRYVHHWQAASGLRPQQP